MKSVNSSIRSIGVSILFSLAVAAVFACTSESGETRGYRPTNTPIPLWETVVDATLVPTVTPSATLSPSPERTPTPEVTSTPSAIPESLSEREVYCREHALPTATVEAGEVATGESVETPTAVPTSPPGIADDEIPAEWIAKMDEIEAWAREFYEMDESEVGEFKRSVIDKEVWRKWRVEAVQEWSEEEDSTVHLWEQINRTLTLLSADSKYTEFLGEYLGDRAIGSYDPAKKEIFIRGDIGDFDVGAELIYLHEYSHHLQNEKYDFVFWSECFRGDGDASGAITALIEGDASNTEYAYIESVIGWERLEAYYDSLENGGGEALDEPVMARLRDEINSFTYGTGAFFVFKVSLWSECAWCETNRQRVDELFKRPPYTTEQIYYEQKYFDDEDRDGLSLPDDVLGDVWELRSGSTIGRSDWIALLATLTKRESDEIEPELPGWRGDYGLLFEDGDGRALHLQVALWENSRYIEGLADAFDAQDRLASRAVEQRSGVEPFEDLQFWESDTGSIAMGIEFEPVDRFYTMFLAVGPDGDSVVEAVYAAREGLVNEWGGR